ncbi:MAG: MBL fold metallo-hydrolase [Gammaproteobacteria bacterium]
MRALLLVVLAAIVLTGLAALYRQHLVPAVLQFALPTDYFEPERYRDDEFVTVADGVYAFRHGFNRSLVVDDGRSLSVFDTFNGGHAAALAAVLSERFPGRDVGWVFYSHHHLDHVRGAAALGAPIVVGHADLMSYVRDFERVDDVLPVNLAVEGDVEFRIGNKRIRLLYLPRSHSETLYAFFLPEEKVLFLPDLMFKDAVPPFGFPDWYYPGYVRALDRLLSLDAEHYVPTHFGIGTRADLESYRAFMVDFQQAVTEALAEHDYDAADGRRLREVLRTVYPDLYARHGQRIGFDAMFVPHFGRQAAGTYLGF